MRTRKRNIQIVLYVEMTRITPSLRLVKARETLFVGHSDLRFPLEFALFFYVFSFGCVGP